MNLTDIKATPIHIAFEEATEKAAARGIRTTGSELIGLIPLHAILEAGRYFLRKQQRSVGISDDEIIKIAIKSMGLDDLKPFDPHEKIIEYAMRKGEEQKRLVDMTVKGFVEETASESVRTGRRLGRRSARFACGLPSARWSRTCHRTSAAGDERWEEFSDWAVKGKKSHERLLQLIDEDTDAFNALNGRLQPAEGHRRREGAPRPADSRCYQECCFGASAGDARDRQGDGDRQSDG